MDDPQRNFGVPGELIGQEKKARELNFEFPRQPQSMESLIFWEFVAFYEQIVALLPYVMTLSAYTYDVYIHECIRWKVLRNLVSRFVKIPIQDHHY